MNAVERPVRTHLDRLRGELGIFQHARGVQPVPGFGYCTDDMARAAMVDVAHLRRCPDAQILADLAQDLTFLEEALDGESGRFRNLRSANGTWLDVVGTEDSHGRAIRALGRIIRDAPGASRDRALPLLDTSLGAVPTLSAPRPLAYVVLGCLDASTSGLPARERACVLGTATSASATLAERFRATEACWPWPESIATYDNAVLPHALIVAGRAMAEDPWVDMGLRSLRWLVTAQSRDHRLQPIGNRGWWPRGSAPADFDQQPIEAAALVEAACAAFEATDDRAWLEVAGMAHAWFLGGNVLRLPLADIHDGSCRDGLGPDGTNENRGAESTLAWLTADEAMTRAGATWPVPVLA